jgi:hypothetical protein
LKVVEKIDSSLRIGRRLKHGALVVFEDFEPGRDVRGVVVADFRRQFEVGAEENAEPSSATSPSQA